MVGVFEGRLGSGGVAGEIGGNSGWWEVSARSDMGSRRLVD
jgi:hypothetical protein